MCYFLKSYTHNVGEQIEDGEGEARNLNVITDRHRKQPRGGGRRGPFDRSRAREAPWEVPARLCAWFGPQRHHREEKQLRRHHHRGTRTPEGAPA